MSSKKRSGHKKAASARREPQTAAELIEEAEWAFLQEKFDQARKLYAKAVELEPENPVAMDHFGAFLADTGDSEAAAEVLRRAVALQPDAGFEKYMYLAQVLEGEEAVGAARRGIEVCRKQLAELEQQAASAAPADEEAAAELRDTLAVLREQLSSCLCSLCELLLNEDQEREAAEEEEGVTPSVAEEVETLLREAGELAPTSPEPLQIRASLRKEQGAAEEALALLRQSMSLWFRPPAEEEEEEAGQGAAAGQGAGEAAEEELGSQDTAGGMEEDEPELPSYEFRFETAKMLMELDPDLSTATAVLEQLLEENDAVPYVHLLLAVCYQEQGETEAALEAVEDGSRLAKMAGLPPDHDVPLGLAELEAELRSLSMGAGAEEGAKAPAQQQQQQDEGGDAK